MKQETMRLLSAFLLATVPAPVAWVDEGLALAAGEAQPPLPVKLEIKPGHPWRPPFGLGRVGRPPDVLVTYVGKGQPQGEFVLVAYREGKEVNRQTLTWITQRPPRPGAPIMARVSLEEGISELALLHSATGGKHVEVARQEVNFAPPPFEAEAVARPDKAINPVDLGAILPPADWLLLAGGQKAALEVAALTRTADAPGAMAVAWYESAPHQKRTAPLPLRKNVKAQAALALAPCSPTLAKDALHVAVTGGDGKELWHRAIRVMIVPKPPAWPAFGAVTTKLRYDAPILSVVNGKYTSIPYEKGWDPKLQDVVVCFPNGARWVFWRGASYCPFWAGRYNTGMSYEWAERYPAEGIGFCEPLFDHELRFGRVEIVESTKARTHVRWTYQTSSFDYRPSGDLAVEDYYFYPDGFGTRVLTLRRLPRTRYELQEFIILSPQSAYPLDILPPGLVDALSLQGEKMTVRFPPEKHAPGAVTGTVAWTKNDKVPVVCRIRLNRHDPLAAISFSPTIVGRPQLHFLPFYDAGTMVTPSYWGSHWPLTRGCDTGWSIDDRLSLGPAANSLLSWGDNNPKPIRNTTVAAKDAAGRTRKMDVQTWVWMIGMSDANDERLVQWAKSFAQPPTLEVTGARADAGLYRPERRALRLVVEKPVVTIALKPAGCCVNPVFELNSEPKGLRSVHVDGKLLDPARYAWDGRTLWLDVTFQEPAELQLRFADPSQSMLMRQRRHQARPRQTSMANGAVNAATLLGRNGACAAVAALVLAAIGAGLWCGAAGTTTIAWTPSACRNSRRRW